MVPLESMLQLEQLRWRESRPHSLWLAEWLKQEIWKWQLGK